MSLECLAQKDLENVERLSSMLKGNKLDVYITGNCLETEEYETINFILLERNKKFPTKKSRSTLEKIEDVYCDPSEVEKIIENVNTSVKYSGGVVSYFEKKMMPPFHLESLVGARWKVKMDETLIDISYTLDPLLFYPKAKMVKL